MNSAVHCHCFPSRMQLHSQPNSIKLYCLVTQAQRWKWLAQGKDAVVPSQDSNLRPVNRKSVALPMASPHHLCTPLNENHEEQWWQQVGNILYKSGLSPNLNQGHKTNSVSLLIKTCGWLHCAIFIRKSSQVKFKFITTLWSRDHTANNKTDRKQNYYAYYTVQRYKIQI